MGIAKFMTVDSPEKITSQGGYCIIFPQKKKEKKAQSQHNQNKNKTKTKLKKN